MTADPVARIKAKSVWLLGMHAHVGAIGGWAIASVPPVMVEATYD